MGVSVGVGSGVAVGWAVGVGSGAAVGASVGGGWGVAVGSIEMIGSETAVGEGVAVTTTVTTAVTLTFATAVSGVAGGMGDVSACRLRLHAASTMAISKNKANGTVFVLILISFWGKKHRFSETAVRKIQEPPIIPNRPVQFLLF